MLYKFFRKTCITHDLSQTGHFPSSYKNLHRRILEADLHFSWTWAHENEKNPCFGPSGYGRRIADLRRITINSSSFADVKRSSGPRVYEKLPGVSHQTGGWRIPIRARIGLRLDISGNRGAYRGWIGGGVDREKGGSGGGFGVSDGDSGAGFCCGRAGKFFVKFF
jgi:hypothetical protein